MNDFINVLICLVGESNHRLYVLQFWLLFTGFCLENSWFFLATELIVNTHSVCFSILVYSFDKKARFGVVQRPDFYL